MKTIINGYLQEDLLKFDIDLVDIEIIKYFQQFSTSRNMKHIEIDGKLYFWLSYQKLIDDLPIIKISTKRTVARRFDNLVEIGLMEKELVNKGNGNMTYFRLTDLHQSWIENMDERFSSVKKDKKEKVEKSLKEDEHIPFKEIIDYLNEKAEREFRNVESNKRHIRARWNEGYVLKDFKKVIDAKVSQWINDDKMKAYLRPETLFGNKFDGYLQEGIEGNENYEHVSLYDFPAL